ALVRQPSSAERHDTAAGTGPGQGGISGHNLPLLVAAIKNPSRDSTDIHGTVPPPTTVRPPLRPVFLAAYAGSGREMVKRTPVHDAQAREGALFRRAGVWHRARYFSADLDVSEEVDNVRTNVGMLDASTLGCFRIFGPDALSALQRVYAGDMSKIKDGRVKYAAMCNHDGCVIDDGVVIRTGENDYMFTTSTGRAGETVEWIRYHTRFDNWDFHLVNLTDGTGVINLAGPRARDVLERVTDADVSNQVFPFGCWKDFFLSGGIPVRCLRLGFVGELSFELNIPASYMQAAWDMLRKAGSGFGLRPFGVEAQNILRLEKGHVILGQESEQRTNLLDLNLGFLFSRDKDIRPVGADALLQAENDAGRLTLVGIRMTDSARVPPDGSILIDEQVVDPVIGYIGTIRKSRALDAVVGMALVEKSWAAEGTGLAVYDGGGDISERYDATVVRMPFYDPDGIRMRM
ncbi:MAG: aminomethyltransferase family protein, partial [Thermodesulfobacteriota bacterium]